MTLCGSVRCQMLLSIFECLTFVAVKTCINNTLHVQQITTVLSASFMNGYFV